MSLLLWAVGADDCLSDSLACDLQVYTTKNKTMTDMQRTYDALRMMTSNFNKNVLFYELNYFFQSAKTEKKMTSRNDLNLPIIL